MIVTQMSIQIHMRDGKEKWLRAIADAWYQKFPRKAAWIRDELARLREITAPSYHAGAAGEMRCTMRVPSELFLFCQYMEPDFGKDSKDIELLIRVWDDFARARNDKRRRTQLVVPRMAETKG